MAEENDMLTLGFFSMLNPTFDYLLAGKVLEVESMERKEC
jgi:hypothetical protein